MSEVAIWDVCKMFASGARALDGVSLRVEAGELLAVVGPSGCGKTTLLRVIAGLETPDSGGVSINGVDVAGVEAGGRGVAMVFQSATLYPHLDVRANLAYALRVRGMGERAIEERVRPIALTLGIEGLLDRKPGTLSGGERQRAALAKALAVEPRVLLMDEPLAGVDPARREEAWAELKMVQREFGVTMVLVTHEHEEALALGDRVAVMHRGRVVQVGSPREVFERPADRFVAGFVGKPRMNLIEGAVVRGARAEFCAGGVRVEVGGEVGDRSRVVLGVRAGDVRVGEGEMEGVVEGVRWSEGGWVATCGVGGVRVEGRAMTRVEVGARVGVCVDRSRVLWFEAEGEGRRLGGH